MKKKIWRIIVVFLAMLFAAGLYAEGMKDRNNTVTLENGDTLHFMRSEEIAGEGQLVNIDFREMTEEEARECFGGLPVSADTAFFGTAGQCIGIRGKIGDVKMTINALGTDSNIRDTEIDGAEDTDEVNGIPVKAGYFLTKPNSRGKQTAIFYASFMVGGYAVYLENAGPEEEREALGRDLAAVTQHLIEQGQFDFSQIQK